MDRDKARKRAKAADGVLRKGKRLGPLRGVPMTRKAIRWRARPQHGMKDNVTETISVAAQRMLETDATLFGKPNVPVALADHQAYKPIYGTTSNPWHVTRTRIGVDRSMFAA